VDGPVVGSDRGASPGGRRGRALRRLRSAAALAVAALLKIWLEAVAKTFVQRDWPAETLSEVILRGQSAARGLSFPSGHAMVIFAIATLVAPYFKCWWRVLPWAWLLRSACRVCIAVRIEPLVVEHAEARVIDECLA
jgi:membrane-associated phospholipid phosphatase